MLHFALFLGSFAANFVAMWKVPVDAAPLFYSGYALASAVGSLFTTGVFTYLKSSKRLKFGFGVGILALSAMEVSFQGVDAIVPILYAGALLLGDYAVSQSGTQKTNTIYRIVMISTVLAFFIQGLTFDQAVIFRSSVAFAFFVVSLQPAFKYTPITLRAPWKFTAMAYVFYSGTLILLPRMDAPNGVIKTWYLISQLGLALLLKVADFTSRSLYSVNKTIETAVLILVVSLLVIGLLASPYYILAGIYIISASALWFAVKRYAIVK